VFPTAGAAQENKEAAERISGWKSKERGWLKTDFRRTINGITYASNKDQFVIRTNCII
jgi:hypothetical protein